MPVNYKIQSSNFDQKKYACLCTFTKIFVWFESKSHWFPLKSRKEICIKHQPPGDIPEISLLGVTPIEESKSELGPLILGN